MDSFDPRQATLDLVTAFVNNNSLKAEELPKLLTNVFGAIAGFEDEQPEAAPQEIEPEVYPDNPVPAPEPEVIVAMESEAPKAAVSIAESISNPEYILSMITGEKMKTLARHLKRHGLDPQGYRARFGLPDDYPMVAPAYSELRRSVARKMELGKIRRARADAAPSAPPAIDTAPEKSVADALQATAPKTASSKATPKTKRKAKAEPAKAAAKAEPASSSAPAKPKAPIRKARIKATTVPGAPPSADAPVAKKMRAEASEAMAVPASLKAPRADGVKASSSKRTRRTLTPAFNG